MVRGRSVSFLLFFRVTRSAKSDNLSAFHGSSKPGNRSFGRFSRPLLEVYFEGWTPRVLKVKSLAVAEIFRYCKGFRLSYSYFCILDQKYKRGAVDSLLAQKLNFSSHTKWEELKISDLFSPVSDKGHSDLTVLTIVQGIGTLPRDSVDRRISYDKASTNTYKRVEKNDFILHLRSFEGGLELANSEGVVSPAYTILRANKVISPSFYYAYFRSYWFISNKLRIAVEGIRDGKSINMDTFWNITIPYPSLDEQYQIAEYLRTVDTRLTNAEQVLENLLRLRSGLMQQLFIWRAVAHSRLSSLSAAHIPFELLADELQFYQEYPHILVALYCPGT